MNFNFQNTNNMHNESTINQLWFIIGMVAIALVLIGLGISLTNNSENPSTEGDNKLISFKIDNYIC